MNGCGYSFWRPQWMQRFANTRWYICVYALLGTVQSGSSTYFNITLTTMEKRFRIRSQTTGFVLSGNEVSQILLSLILTYYSGRNNGPKWMSWGVVTSALSCFILAWPHFIYGAGDEALQYTKEYLSGFNNISTEIIPKVTVPNSNDNKLCQNSTSTSDDCDEEFSNVPLVLIFFSQFVLGIGNTLYYSIGQTYIDDNSEQHKSPILLSYAYAIRIFGPTLGYGFAYVILRIYIDPTLTPVIEKDDPRWLGAWWLGWILIGIVMFVFAVLIGLFPRKIQVEKSSEELELDGENCEKNADLVKKESTEAMENGDLKDFPKAVWRLMTNKLLMLNCFNAVFYILAFSGSLTFMGRLMEVQFNKTAAGGSIFTGPLTMVGMAIGMVVSGTFITKIKPRPSRIFFWNIIVGLIILSSTITNTQLGCENSNSLEVNGTIYACNSNCACGGITYTPVCDRSTTRTYFSPCHAGCKSFDEKLNVYTDCVCSDETKTELQVDRLVTPGACVGDCNFDYYAYSIIFMVSSTISVTGFIANILLNFRCVEPRDKAMAQGFALFTASLFGLIPSPIIFGRLIDTTCMIWNNKCGRKGNCLLYDPLKFRYYLHTTAAMLVSVGVLFDILIWFNARNIDLYGSSSSEKSKKIENRMEMDDLPESEPLKK